LNFQVILERTIEVMNKSCFSHVIRKEDTVCIKDYNGDSPQVTIIANITTVYSLEVWDTYMYDAICLVSNWSRLANLKVSDRFDQGLLSFFIDSFEFFGSTFDLAT